MVICCNSTYVFSINILSNKIFLTIYKQITINGFLIVISPIMAATYSINKTKISGKGGKSKIFAQWFREYCVNVALQPLHAAIYLSIYSNSKSNILQLRHY